MTKDREEDEAVEYVIDRPGLTKGQREYELERSRKEVEEGKDWHSKMVAEQEEREARIEEASQVPDPVDASMKAVMDGPPQATQAQRRAALRQAKAEIRRIRGLEAMGYRRERDEYGNEITPEEDARWHAWADMLSPRRVNRQEQVARTLEDIMASGAAWRDEVDRVVAEQSAARNKRASDAIIAAVERIQREGEA